MTKPIITFQNFNFQYDSQAEPTLKKINLEIFPGERVLIAGESGSGKSTLGRCINGLIPEAYPGKLSGTCLINGHHLQDSSIFELSFDVGTVLQDPDSQFVGLTVVEDLAFSLENDCCSQEKMASATQKWAERLHLTELLKHSPQEISGGQKQRVAMAGVLIDESKILLFDEPLANLDPAAGRATMKLLNHLAKQQELTVIIIEHRIEEALQVGIDRLVLMKNGQIVANDIPAKILKDNLLPQLGLREPLYLSAIKQCGVDLQACQNLLDSKKITAVGLADKLQQWNTATILNAKIVRKEPLLVIKQLSFGYQPELPIIRQLSLTIYRGEMISLVGQNGTGKSTLSNLITGFLQPQAGQILFAGEDLLKLSVKQRAAKIGYILQDPNQMISQTKIFDEVASGLRLRKVSEDQVKDKVYYILRICGLYEMRHWPISALSFGQKKRVTIAAILVLEPQMLILDEPTAGQDLKHYTEIMTFLEKLQLQQNLTIILITHDMHLMLEYTQRTLVLNAGNLLADATPAEVLTNAQIIEKASLAQTSLYDLTQRFNLPSANEFIAKFIQTERQERQCD
ncbi:ABC transporter ATP-binding protein [Liquorilactobacillus vini]|uniref:ABC transporter ATP-binding protein n=3 Tax=Liquorilactobacillus vini TaxID=238015 RepID=A0A0R2CMI8_9LACO|nr:ABC transporter ATP-binding protein [Liquorilactobacillus vini]KRM89532.1 ABC transporter ATP-binding protein [Liquorilactobacillus vini DSM 20605]